MAPSLDSARLRPTVAAVWLGMLIGVSFIATPVKFQAAGLDLATALDVGRLTFGAFSRVEWVLAALLVVTGLSPRVLRWRQVVTGVIVLGVAVQALWLLPALDARVAVIMAGNMPEPSRHHALYAGVEIVKVFGLASLGLPSWRGSRARAPFPGSQDWTSDAA